MTEQGQPGRHGEHRVPDGLVPAWAPVSSHPFDGMGTDVPETRRSRAARRAAQAAGAGPVDGPDGLPVTGPVEPDGADGADGPERPDGPRRRLVLWVWLAVGAVVLAAAAVLLSLVLGGGDDTPEPVATVTHTRPAPTPTGDPVARGEGSALFLALPGTVRQLVLTEIAPAEPSGPLAGAVEAYTLTYAGPAEALDAASPDIQVDVVVAQWPSPEKAADAAAALVAEAGTPTSAGDVEVDGTVTGAYTFLPGDQAGSAAVVWSNGTLVLRATGPADELENFYAAYAF